MFGNKNRLSSEELQLLKEQLDGSRNILEEISGVDQVLAADTKALGEAADRISQDAQQISDNVDSVYNMSQENIEAESILIHNLDEICEQYKLLEDQQSNIASMVKALAEDIQNTVEQNKHFTTPSKDISDIPVVVRENTNSSRNILVHMSDFSKQMSVLSLNAAIEAGRMGDQGKDFVKAAEEIRNYTSNYNTQITKLQNLMDEQEKWSAKIDEQIRHLIGLLKENNIATAKLMKQGNELVRAVDKSQEGINSESIAQLRESVVEIRTTEEEILKAEERNRMQTGYISEEVSSLHGNVQEISDKIQPLFGKAADLLSNMSEKE